MLSRLASRSSSALRPASVACSAWRAMGVGVVASPSASPPLRALFVARWTRADTDAKASAATPVDDRFKEIKRQADTGLGAQPILSKPTPPAGTIDVTIGGESSSAKEEDYNAGAVPSVARSDQDWTLSHPLWHSDSLRHVRYTHFPPPDTTSKLALWTIRAIRFNFDWMSGYSFGALTEKKAITRICFLETVAGVPGSIGALVRHLASLRRMKRDGGWINTLFEEAENERMHLLTALQVRQPGPFMRAMVFLTQGVFFNFFFVAYLASPKYCHRLVGYLEEEAVRTYTHILQSIDGGELKGWATQPAPDIARRYWALKDGATMRDVMFHIRADEAHHRDVNHTLASLKEEDLNPFRTGPVGAH